MTLSARSVDALLLIVNADAQQAKNGLPPAFVSALRSAGASSAQIADMQKTISTHRIPNAAIDLAASLSNPELSTIDRQDATLMRAYAHLVRG